MPRSADESCWRSRLRANPSPEERHHRQTAGEEADGGGLGSARSRAGSRQIDDRRLAKLGVDALVVQKEIVTDDRNHRIERARDIGNRAGDRPGEKGNLKPVEYGWIEERSRTVQRQNQLSIGDLDAEVAAVGRAKTPAGTRPTRRSFSPQHRQSRCPGTAPIRQHWHQSLRR